MPYVVFADGVLLLRLLLLVLLPTACTSKAMNHVQAHCAERLKTTTVVTYIEASRRSSDLLPDGDVFATTEIWQCDGDEVAGFSTVSPLQ